jgi:hypothetical protein
MMIAHALPRVMLAATLSAALGGCTAIAVGGAVVGAGVTVASTAVGAGVTVGKGVVSVASAPFRSGDKDK